jgi:hypothetical protein
MESNLDEFLKHRLSVQETNIDAPILERMSDARRIVEARKWKPIKKQTGLFSLISLFLFSRSTFYQVGLMGAVVVMYVFYFNLGNTTLYTGAGGGEENGFINSANSNTLAGLTHTSTSRSVQSTTVLPSIFTFASQN